MGFLGLVDTDEDIAVEETPVTKPIAKTTLPETSGVSVIGRSKHSEVATPAAAAPVDNSYHIISLQPRSYSEARQVGEAFREGNPVIVNLDDMEESERKRLVDFASGLVFGHHGRIERISLKVFLLSPANVNVSNEDRTSAQASFFNQS